jgi:cardiolipin synthase
MILKPRYIPNIITVLRLLLIIPIAYTLLTEHYRYALGFFMLAGLSDGVDGYLARHFAWLSTFGAVADPLADKFLMVVTYFCLAWINAIPAWLFIVVMFRDVWLMLGVVLFHYYIESPAFKPSLVSKINTCLQLLLVVVILFTKAWGVLPHSVIMAFTYLVLVTTLLSFLDYTWVWGKRAYEALTENKPN